jgi:hypothetical protein
MAMLIADLGHVEARDGRVLRAQVHGEQRSDGLWDGWLAFFGAQGDVWRTGRETSQSSSSALRYWAGGLTRTYLDGALRRAEPAAVTPPGTPNVA